MRSVVVLGPYRGGTSLVTGIIESLGVFVGERFLDARTGYNTYEALRLREQCLKCFDERSNHWGYQRSYAQRVVLLQQWYSWACSVAQQRGAVAVGGKHPTMCMLVDELAEAWRDKDGNPPLFVSVQRSEADVLRSWRNGKFPNGSPWWPRADLERVVHELMITRDTKLTNHHHVAISFDQLRKNPERSVRFLASSCNLDQSYVDSAIKLIKPAS